MPDTPALTPRRERAMLLTLAAVQFIHIVDFMLMMPLGPQLTRLFGISDAQLRPADLRLHAGRWCCSRAGGDDLHRPLRAP